MPLPLDRQATRQPLWYVCVLSMMPLVLMSTRTRISGYADLTEMAGKAANTVALQLAFIEDFI